MGRKVYKLHCEICNWTRITDGSDVGDLYEIKTSPIPGGFPELDKDKKIVEKEALPRPRKFRCPQCGRVISPRIAPNPQEKIDQYRRELAAQEQRREWDVLEDEAKKKYKEYKDQYEREQSELD